LDGACVRACPVSPLPSSSSTAAGRQARASGSSGVGSPVGGGNGNANRRPEAARFARLGWAGRFQERGPRRVAGRGPRYPAAPSLAGSVLELHALPAVALRGWRVRTARRTRPARTTAGSFSADLAKDTLVFTHAAAAAVAPTSGEDPIAGLARRKLVAIDRLRFFEIKWTGCVELAVPRFKRAS